MGVKMEELATQKRLWTPHDPAVVWRVKMNTEIYPITSIIQKRAKALDKKLTDIPWHVTEGLIHIVHDYTITQMDYVSLPDGWHKLYIQFAAPIQDNGYILFGFLCSTLNIECLKKNRYGAAT